LLNVKQICRWVLERILDTEEREDKVIRKRKSVAACLRSKIAM